MIVKEVLDRTTQFFKEKKFESPRLDAELLLAKALNLPQRIDLYLKFDQPLKDEELQLARDFVRRRSLGEPVAYILGVKGFYQSDFKVTPAVLIPRPETEFLVEKSIEWIVAKKAISEKLSILDLGCGSGCIGISIAKDLFQKGFQEPHVTFVDISNDALEITKENCKRNQINNAEFICSDVSDLQLIENKYDLVLANPPYIATGDLLVEENVKKFEPNQALYSGPVGTELLKIWSQHSIHCLKTPGLIGFELGKDQGQEMKTHFAQLAGITHTEIVKDLAHLDRHVIGIKEVL